MQILVATIPAALCALFAWGRPPEGLLAAVSAVAFLWMPGRGFVRAMTRDPLARGVWTFLVSCLLCVPAVLVGAWTGLGAPGSLAAAAVLSALGHLLPPLRDEALAPGPRVGVLAVLVAVGALAWSFADTLTRPLERHVWSDDVEQGAFTGTLPENTIGFVDARVGESLRLLPRRSEGALVGPMQGPVLLVLRGPVEATLEVGGSAAVPGVAVIPRGTPARTMTVESDPVVNADEGPVPRYLDRGATTLRLDRGLQPGERLRLGFSHAMDSVLYVVPSTDALWDLHGRGELRHVHYYQLLNMVEQVRWARELYEDRRVTTVQPPLQAYVAAGPLGMTHGDLPTQAVLALGTLAVLGMACVGALAAWTPNLPLPAWLLPAGATLQAGRLLLEPGSFGMPDALATLAVVVAAGSLARTRGGYVGAGVVAQLARYHAGPLAVVPALLDGQFGRAGRLLAALVVLVVLGILAGSLTGQLGAWVDTVGWEIGPEHWHGNFAAGELLARVAPFYAQWMRYGGGLPVLGVLLFAGGRAFLGREGAGRPLRSTSAARPPPHVDAHRAARIFLGTAGLFSLLLCTIDHAPSHYFLPLVVLGTVGFGATCDGLRGRARSLVPLAALASLGWACARVPITG